MIRPRRSLGALALAGLLAGGCAAGGARLSGTVVGVAPGAVTVRDPSGETVVRVDERTHFWSGGSLDQLRIGDRVSLQVERRGDVVAARSLELFPAGRPRSRWIGPEGY